jgi:defect-in-organelle-trafficking protein DotB
VPVTNRKLLTDEINDLIDEISKSNAASADLQSGKEKNFSYALKKDRNTTYRFRVNATSTQLNGPLGCAVTMRFIPPFPPMLEDLAIEAEILEAVEPADGFVIVSGNTGTGKTTLLAAVMRNILSKPGKSIVTYEQPVEFMLKDLPERKSLIDHHEIGTNLLTWENAPANANRRDPDIVFLGEAKERETFAGMLELGNIGKACYVSLHTTRPRMVIPRILDKFPYDERAQAASILISNLRVLISQKLLLHSNGKKRVAVREFVVFTAEDREALLRAPIEEIPLYIDKLVNARQTSFVTAAQKEFDAGNITEATFQGLQKEFN